MATDPWRRRLWRCRMVHDGRPLHRPVAIGDITLALLDRPPGGSSQVLYYRVETLYADGSRHESSGRLANLATREIMAQTEALLRAVRAEATRRLVTPGGLAAPGVVPLRPGPKRGR